MTAFVLLIDQDDGTALVACPDEETADQVGAAAIWSSGGVSAYRVPTWALADTEAVVERLRDGRDTSELEGLSGVAVAMREVAE